MSHPPSKFLGVQHIAIKVHDIDEAIKFYTEVLGLRVSERRDPGFSRSGSPGMAFLSCRINHHDINLVFSEKEKPQEPTGHTFTAGGTGLHHLALLVANKEEFEAWYRHITACGIKVVHGPVVHSSIHPEGDRTPGENRSFYFPDPSGNVIEILCDMGQMTSDNQIDMKWHAERLRRDGYPEEADRVREERSLR